MSVEMRHRYQSPASGFAFGEDFSIIKTNVRPSRNPLQSPEAKCVFSFNWELPEIEPNTNNVRNAPIKEMDLEKGPTEPKTETESKQESKKTEEENNEDNENNENSENITIRIENPIQMGDVTLDVGPEGAEADKIDESERPPMSPISAQRAAKRKQKKKWKVQALGVKSSFGEGSSSRNNKSGNSSPAFREKENLA
uniref:Uncharacterized protein n=1 Tax=Lotharella globosa TaxID=91324 RepID=A0A7S3Z7Y0_9EUKA|eukprot:CAMPEP_0167789836 /NCGR_PEP_ID=MMETSP0111_2-20121227/10929_1 /TAXON_ID=91324 /ORGANISM="Lotharella globosa, Strain CCCM811" /LENGTH=196 /DNA_ID=CAMNT_0007682093 /DNA_START=6 /DNA_END=596 /DNA_ORIENTATION=-